MSFLSPGFFLFFPLVTLVWFLLPGTARRLWLLCASWWFLLCAGPEHLFSLIAATTLTYCGAQLLDKAEGRRRKFTLAALLTVLFGALFLVKYLAFALGLLERVSAVLFHLFATSLVFTAVIRRKPLWYFAAVAAHTLFNSLAVLLAGFGLLAVELVLFALGLAMGAWVLASRRRWPA